MMNHFDFPFLSYCVHSQLNIFLSQDMKAVDPEFTPELTASLDGRYKVYFDITALYNTVKKREFNSFDNMSNI